MKVTVIGIEYCMDKQCAYVSIYAWNFVIDNRIPVSNNIFQGVSIPGFGVFSFSNKKIDVGNNKFILIQRPILLISEKLARTHGIVYTKHHISGECWLGFII